MCQISTALQVSSRFRAIALTLPFVLMAVAAGRLDAQTPQMSPQDVAPPWLSDTVTPRAADVASQIVTEDIRVMPIGPISRNAVGLLPVQVTGFPSGLWGQSKTGDLAALFRRLPMTGPPAILDLTGVWPWLSLVPADQSDMSTIDLFLAQLICCCTRRIWACPRPDRAFTRAWMILKEHFRRWFDVLLWVRRIVPVPRCVPTRHLPLSCASFASRGAAEIGRLCR